MVLKAKQTTVAYRCPHCGKGVLSAVDIFSLGGDMLKLKCECGESAMTVVKGANNEGKLRLTVPCLFCPTPHNFTVSSKVFFENDLPVTTKEGGGIGVKSAKAVLEQHGGLMRMVQEEHVFTTQMIQPLS